MGGAMARITGEHIVYVRTGDRKGAGTDANVFLILHDEEGNKTPAIKLNSFLRNDHERGDTGSYYFPKKEGFGRVSKIEMWRDAFGLADDWFVDRVTLEYRKEKNSKIYFPINRWIKPNKRYIFKIYDCSLPQEDEHQQQRSEELAEKKQLYEYTRNIEGGPVQIKAIPEGENFTDQYSWDIKSMSTKLKLDAKLIGLTSDKWESLQDLKNIFKLSLSEPSCLPRWNDDKWFAMQRLQGLNPISIQLCLEIPESFGANVFELEPMLENLTLRDALDAHRIFIVDLKILKNLPCKDDRTICAPLALFFLNKNKELVPLAIQLFQDKAPDNPVFFPTDPPYTWMLAKMFFNNADATYHRACLAIGRTHLMMESIWVCTNRNLSPSHPVFKLLAPHFYFLLAVNSMIMEKFMAMGGWVDRVMTIGMRGLCSLIARGFREWKIDRDLNIPREIESRGVMDPDVLPYYPYRDDSVDVYKAIHEYVSRIVKHHYEKDGQISEDTELQNWREELIKTREEGGCHIMGVPGDHQLGFTNVEEIIETLTAIIANCSVFHAAVNFQQYDECSFPPNYPQSMRGVILRDKRPRTEKDILEQLPNKETTFDVVLAMRMLSTKATKSLGDFEVRYLFDPSDVEAHKEFVEELKNISEKIKKRNETRKCAYTWLDPEIIPNSVAI